MISNDASRWPLVVVRVDGTPTTREHVLEFIASQRSMLARGEPFVEIADSRDAKVISALERKLLADWLGESEQQSKRLCVALAVLISSPVIRGAMNAVLWIRSPSFPMHMCGTEDEVVRFLSDAVQADARIPHVVSSLQSWRLRPTG